LAFIAVAIMIGSTTLAFIIRKPPRS